MALKAHRSASTLTFAMPAERKPSASAAADETSMTRPPVNGPRSLMITTTLRLFFKLVTRAFEPKGSVRCAAVKSPTFFPLAVRPLSP